MKKVTLLCCTFLLLGVRLCADNIITEENIHLQTYFCDTPVDVCLDLPLNELPNYQVLQDGSLYAGSIAGCDFDTIINYTYSTLFGQGNMGPYHLDSWEVNNQSYSGEFNDIDELIALMNSWDPAGNWTHSAAMMMISGGASGSNYSDMNVTALINNLPSIIGLNFGVVAQGTQLAFQVGTYELIFLDAANDCADTVQIVVECLPPPQPSTFTDTISADGYPHAYCIDTLELPGVVTEIYNACPDQSGTFVNFTLNDFCLKYQGVKCGGTETACIVVCDDLGFCDTTYIDITVDFVSCDMQPEKITDTLLVNFSDSYCLDTLELPGTIVSAENVCEANSSGFVDFQVDPDTYCVTYTGMEVGLDTACFVLTDEYGNQDTTSFCILVEAPVSEKITDTLEFGTSMTYCLDTEELAGTTFTIFNDCQNMSGNALNFEINELTLCIEATAIGFGTESACIVICDEFAACDTTCIQILVEDNGDPCALQPTPTALNDTVSTLKNEMVNIVILDNDTIPPCSPSDFEIISNPQNGLAVRNADGSVDYLPNLEFCGLDSFEYVLCNDYGCDSALVVIDVLCVPDDQIIIYNGFSPNEDGTNDTFTIENIENFPNNSLLIYNRWGSLVYQTEGYNNDWDGTYDGNPLPDGTYFYLLELEERQTFKGYVQLRR